MPRCAHVSGSCAPQSSKTPVMKKGPSPAMNLKKEHILLLLSYRSPHWPGGPWTFLEAWPKLSRSRQEFGQGPMGFCSLAAALLPGTAGWSSMHPPTSKNGSAQTPLSQEESRLSTWQWVCALPRWSVGGQHLYAVAARLA